MTSDRPTIKNRAIEAGLWVAVVIVGGYLLLPAAVDLVQTTQQERREEAEAAKLEQQLEELQNRNDATAKDPEALQKIREQRELEMRRKQNDERTE